MSARSWTAAAMAGLVVAGSACNDVTGPSATLGPVTSETTTSVREAYVGTEYSFGFTPFEPHGRGEIRLVRATLRNVDAALEVVGVRALSRKTSPSTPGVFVGDPQVRDPRRFTFVPLNDVSFRDGEPEEYFLVATVRPKRRGTWHVEGLAVEYKAGGKTKTASYDYGIELTVNHDGHDPRADMPIDMDAR